MRVGIIAEGWADVEVLKHILKGQLGLDVSTSVMYLRPELGSDETDLHSPGARQYSNWELVKQELCDKIALRDFLENEIEEEKLVVVHLDTAECHLPGYDVDRPQRGSSTYVYELVYAVLAKITEWLGDYTHPALRFAIAVEETDAWVLPLYSDEQTCMLDKPKEELLKLLNGRKYRDDKEVKQALRSRRERDRAKALAKGLRNERDLRKAAARNESLAIFLRCLGERVEE